MSATISTIEAKEKFAELIDQVAHNKERVILTRRGNEIAALVPIEDLHLLEASQNKHDLQEAAESLKEARSVGVVTLDDLKTESS